MKKRNIISLIFLLLSAQIYGSATANPALALIIACQAADSFNNATEEEYDNVIAEQIIEFINECILTDKNLQQQLAASVNGYIFKGKPLDPKAIAAQNAKLQKDIKNYDQNIKKLKGSNNTMSVAHKEKIKNRQDNRKKQQQKLQQNITALQSNEKAESDATAQANIAKNLIAQNQLSLDQAIEYYIATFGQCYTTAGGYVSGSKTVISSRYNKNMPITPALYNDFIQSLNQASSQFGSTISISLALNDGVEASIKDVTNYVANMAPSSTSYTTYALVGLGIATATVAALAANNIAQGRDWSDTTVYADLANQSYASGMSSAQNLYDSAYSYVTGTKEDGTSVTPAEQPAIEAAITPNHTSKTSIYDANQQVESVGGKDFLAGMKNLYQSALGKINGYNINNIASANEQLDEVGGKDALAAANQFYQNAKTYNVNNIYDTNQILQNTDGSYQTLTGSITANNADASNAATENAMWGQYINN